MPGAMAVRGIGRKGVIGSPRAPARRPHGPIALAVVAVPRYDVRRIAQPPEPWARRDVAAPRIAVHKREA